MEQRESDPCPSENSLAELASGVLSPDAVTRLEQHLARCAECREVAAGIVDAVLASGHAGAIDAQGENTTSATRTTVHDADPQRLERGSEVGRYVILEMVGVGAMGAVYAAHDPILDRRVALKLLRTDLFPDARETKALHALLLREAQAMARLSDPNVITVFDVGSIGGQLFIAMEYIEGCTLREWLSREQRSWREVLDIFRRVGSGLAAAHSAGLVHRDFKPDNVLIGDDGRVCVADFGLARGMTQSVEHRDWGPRAVLATDLTRTGTVLGTPAYMAPEQRQGKSADARSDQYSFSVALFEALYGERPHAARPLSKSEPKLVRTRETSSRAVPRWLLRIVARGIAIAPEDRHESMRELLQRLQAGPAITARRVVAAGVVISVAAAFAVLSERTTRSLCTGADVAWGDTWSASERDRLRAAFLDDGRPERAPIFAKVESALDTYRARWIAAHTEACRATRLRGEQSEAMLDLRMRCLQDRRRELAALIRELHGASPFTLDQAPSVLAHTATLDACANTNALADVVPLPEDPAARAEIARLGDTLAELNALQQTGQGARLKALLSATSTQASGYPPLQARMLWFKAKYEDDLQHLVPATALFHRTVTLALKAHEDWIAADSWIELVRIAGLRGDIAGAEQWADYAGAAIERLGGDDEREATRLTRLAFVYYFRARRLEDARDLLLRARALYIRARGDDHVELGRVERTLSEALFEMGDVEEGLAAIHRSAAHEERSGGAHNLWLGLTYTDEANELMRLGRLDDAEAALERAAATLPYWLRGDDGWYRHRHAQLLRMKGDYGAALEEDRRSRDYYASASGEDQDQAWALTGEGIDLIALHRPKEAIAPLERAAAVRRQGSAGEELGETLFALARARWESNRDRARARALAVEARSGYQPFADRYGIWYRDAVNEIDAWLAAHDLREAPPR